MKYLYDPKNIVKNNLQIQEDYLTYKANIEFNVGQIYDKEPAKTLICKHCGSEEFKVGQGSHFTAVKCVKCDYEICVHDG